MFFIHEPQTMASSEKKWSKSRYCKETGSSKIRPSTYTFIVNPGDGKTTGEAGTVSDVEI